MATEPVANDVLLGSGRLYIDRFVSGAASGNERFVGNCTAFEIKPSTQRIEKRSSVDSARAVLRSDVTAADLDISITLDEFNAENLALALFGEAGLYTQTGASVTDEAHANVQQGSYVRLAYRGISSVVVTSDPAGTTYDVTDDYTVDAVEGRIYIVPGGAIADDAEILVDYAYETQSKTAVRGVVASSIKALLRYVSDNPDSPEHSLLVWRAALSGESAVGLISDNYANFQLTGKVESDADTHPTEPHYRIIRR
jgi:hypothetical protein